MPSSIFASLGIARDALAVQQLALDVAQNNISNVNTPGYARQRINLVPGDPVAQDVYQAGAGVHVASIESYRDRFLDHRVNEELQRQGELSASSSMLQQVESMFNETSGSGLQSTIAAFFNSFSSLANSPEDMTLRQEVLVRGEALGAEFRQTYEALQSVQTAQDRAITDTVADINTIATDIARLNVEVLAASGSNGNGATLRDQRQQLVDRLAQLTDVSYFETETGSITVMSRQGALIVVGDQSFAWQAAASTSGPGLVIQSGGVDITAKVQSGKLGGLLRTRDASITAYLSALDDMAAGIISRVNAQHAQGGDYSGVQGGDFFVPFTPGAPGSNRGAARAIQMAITDPARIAAAAIGGGAGSNVNARKLAGIKDERILSGNTATIDQVYANLVFKIGRDTKSVMDGLETQDQLLTQLQNQRDAATGVSLDEEAVSIMRYQKAYQANARFINILDTLTEETIRLLGGGA
jgi:flagellar hook-associated protein 1